MFCERHQPELHRSLIVMVSQICHDKFANMQNASKKHIHMEFLYNSMQRVNVGNTIAKKLRQNIFSRCDSDFYLIV